MTNDEFDYEYPTLRRIFLYARGLRFDLGEAAAEGGGDDNQ